MVCITADNGQNIVKAVSINNWTLPGLCLNLIPSLTGCVFFKEFFGMQIELPI